VGTGFSDKDMCKCMNRAQARGLRSINRQSDPQGEMKNGAADVSGGTVESRVSAPVPPSGGGDG
jgi:hypothetical protein